MFSLIQAAGWPVWFLVLASVIAVALIVERFISLRRSQVLPNGLLDEVLAGGASIARDAGFVVVGGHTIDDPEPKYGMAVTGEVHPDRMLTNRGLRAGQDLVLTKPLGVGVVTTAIKVGTASDEHAAAAVESMTRLNDVACRVAVDAGATGCTDVTGFGLLGHLGRMSMESGIVAEVSFDSIPFLPGTFELADGGAMPGGSRRNLAWASDLLDAGTQPTTHQLLAADAQTSGGLVFGVDPGATAAVLAALEESGHRAAHIGATTERSDDADHIAIVLR